MIEIKTLNKSQLDAYISTEAFPQQIFLPISRHRALSHMANPRAGEQDVLLLLAFENDILVGYLGALPDYLFYDEKQHETCAWLSCMWIDEKHRGKKIAQHLLQKCFDVWQHKILVTEFTEAAKGLYDKTGVFEDLQIRQGIRLYLRSDLAKILPARKPAFQKFQSVLKVFDVLLNAICDLRFYFVKREKYRIETIDHIDKESLDFIQTHQSGQIFRRGAEELDWMLKNPWILAAEEDAMSVKYHFSSVDTSFDFYPLKLRNKEGKLIACLVFAKRHKSLKLPYCYMEKGAEKEVARLIEEQILTWRINTFTCFEPSLVVIFKAQDTLALFKKDVKRHYIIAKGLKALLKDTEHSGIQDGDADAAFT